MNTASDKDNLNKMMLHIHEQFAVNHSSTLSSTITIIVTMFCVLGWYGKIVFDILNNEDTSLQAFVFITIVCESILTLTAYISIFQGFNYRKEQFVIDRIRKYFDKEKEIFDREKIIPWEAKGKYIYNFIPGLYGLFYKASITIIVGIFFISIYIIIYNIPLEYCCCIDLWLNFILLLITTSISLLLIFVFLCRNFIKYRKIKKNNNKIE